MSNRYAPIPNPRSDPVAQNEMEAAFDDPEGDDEQNTSETQPLNPPPPIPGSYDFENVDYDYPPPGSPPAPSSFAVPNNHGNSNGVIPSFSALPVPRRGWFKKTATAILPSYYLQRFGLASNRPAGTVGGGVNNDGVFANVTAKPSRPTQITDGSSDHSGLLRRYIHYFSGDDTYLVPEDSRAEAPPSYAHAQCTLFI